jgi:hypothetical protein
VDVSAFDIKLPSYEALALQRLRIGLEQRIGAQVIESLELHQVEDIFTRSIVTRLTADVLAEKLPPEKIERSKTVALDFPASSWQHFKQEHSESWWLRWLVRRWPVRIQQLEQTVTLTVDLERYRTFPQCNYVFPKDLGPFVNVAVTRDHWSLR